MPNSKFDKWLAKFNLVFLDQVKPDVAPLNSQVIHERNAHNFPLDLASANLVDLLPVATQQPDWLF